MGVIQGRVVKATGTFLERKLLNHVPGLIDYSDDTGRPDFQWGSIALEAKVGYDKNDFAARIKRKQLLQMRTFDPLVYVFGYHDFAEANNRLTNATINANVQYLEQHARLTRLFFVSAIVVKNIWRVDKRKDKNGGVYCTVRANTLANIIANKAVTRNGVEAPAQEHYGTSRYEHEPAKPLGFILTPRDYNSVAPLILSIDPAIFA